MKRVAMIAATTALGLTAVTTSLVPSPHRSPEAELQRQYRVSYERQIAEARRRGDAQAEAILRDRLRAAEHRPPPDAGRVIRGALRRGLK